MAATIPISPVGKIFVVLDPTRLGYVAFNEQVVDLAHRIAASLDAELHAHVVVLPAT